MYLESLKTEPFARSDAGFLQADVLTHQLCWSSKGIEAVRETQSSNSSQICDFILSESTIGLEYESHSSNKYYIQTWTKYHCKYNVNAKTTPGNY